MSVPAPPLRFAVLGPIQAWHGETPVELGPVRQRAVLACLLLRPGVTVTKEQLAHGVWGAEPPITVNNVLATYVLRLRRALAEAGTDTAALIVTDVRGGGYRFAGDGVQVDAAEVEALTAEAQAARRADDLATAVTRYSSALERFAGEPLAGLPGPFAEGQRRRLRDRELALWQARYECQLQLGRHDEAADDLSALAAWRPEQGPLAALWERAVPSSAVTGTAGRAAVPNQLPAAPGDLVGRDRVVARLTAPPVAPVTALDGMAGVGKTALAVQAAWQLLDRYPDGCLFVNLRGHAEGRPPLEPRWALCKLLRDVGAEPERTDDVDELAGAWRSATASLRLLLVLDDAATAGQVRPLLPGGGGSRVLVTSRRSLVGLADADRVSLRPLAFDDAERLLAGMAGAARADAHRDAVRDVARLCGRLPLALRIAGARLHSRPMWTFADLVDRLAPDERRLDELTADDHSVQAAFQLSYAQLPADARRAFRLLGVAPTTELDRLTLAAMLACPPLAAERILEQLVDANLLLQPVAGRYRLHDLVAVYARRLAEVEPDVVVAAREGVFRLYVAAARCASDRGRASFPTGPVGLEDAPFVSQAEAVAWLDDAAHEVVDVVAQARDTGFGEYACWIAEALNDYLVRQGRFREWHEALTTALPVVDKVSDQRMAAALRIGLGGSCQLQGQYVAARDWLREGLRISERTGDLHNQASAWMSLSWVHWFHGDAQGVIHCLATTRALAERLRDTWLIANVEYRLGVAHRELGQQEMALTHLTEAVSLVADTNDERMASGVLGWTGYLYLDLGRFAEGAKLLRRALALAQRTGDHVAEAFIQTALGSAEHRLGNVAAAIALARQAVAAVAVAPEPAPARLEFEARLVLGDAYLADGRRDEARREFALARDLTAGNHDRPEQQAHARALSGLRRCHERDSRDDAG